MLYTSVFAGDGSGHAVLTAGAVAVATLVVLAGRLPGHPEPDGDLWPPDAQIDGMVDEHREFCLCLVPREPGTLDPREHLGCRQVGNPLRRVRRFYCRLVPPARLHMLDPRTRPALRLAHGIQHAAQV
jgi:hypothetical protein